MKKVFLIALVVFSATMANAQEKHVNGNFEKDDIYISGSLGFNNNSTSSLAGQDVVTSAFTFSPSIGYFISENIALKLGLSIGNTSSEFGGQDTETGVFGINLGGVYFFSPEDNFSFILGADVFYSSASQEVAGVKQPDTNAFGLLVSPGVNYFISESFALRASVGTLSYYSSKIDFNGAPSTNNFSLNVNLSNINLGLTYKF